MTQPDRTPLGSLTKWLAAGSAFVLWSLLLNVTAGIGLQDEAWFVRLGQRLLQGDTLYGEVAYGVTPLAAWVIWGASATFGVELLTLKMLVALCFAASSVVCLWAAARLGSSPSALVILALTLALLTPPTLQSLYSPLAHLFFILSFALLISRPALSPLRVTALGIILGLCFASKQNVGLLALAATLVSLFPRQPPDRRIRIVALLLGTFATTAALVHLPVFLQHATAEFLDYAFVGKGTYLRVGRVSYSEGLAELRGLVTSVSSWRDLRSASTRLPLLLPLLAAAALALRSIRDRRRSATAPPLALMAFLAGGFLTSYPRFDLVHVAATAPWMLLGLTYACRGLSGSLPGRAARTMTLLVLCVLLGGRLTDSARRVISAEYGLSRLPHMRGVLVEWQQEEEIFRSTRELAAAGSRDPLFLLTPSAGLYHLTTGLPNHTPYDYPLVTTFGREGEMRVVRALEEGELLSVCLDPRIERLLAPPRILEFVTRRMTPDRDLGPCTLYRPSNRPFRRMMVPVHPP